MHSIWDDSLLNNNTKGGKNIGEDIQPLNNLFSDNIIIYYPIEDKLI